MHVSLSTSIRLKFEGLPVVYLGCGLRGIFFGYAEGSLKWVQIPSKALDGPNALVHFIADDFTSNLTSM